MEIPNSIIDPATADPDTAYVVALKDDDWDHWDSIDSASVFNGRRRRGARWNLRDIADGKPVDWGYADDEIVVIRHL
ncbi:hypothetical protein AN480_29065 (plasmid) [Mycobacterium intracellulare subsp. chimaera]|uniref:Uncharacterized protein n=1 Tax=Mycobacterium intracellulare subsp. chimaera TaxID=222805 RepID=A0ABT7P9V3_MYCIT|nr:hypothetical protein [Mycobacterium intracellulare]AOS95071.1 hypothetical protein AN480_29065 [Mycobacterium intracellulare subsp. chimaera]MDM3929828.1 hypothetical protein [Mycobacterium intracellulare subsp. chimaera]